MSGFIEFFDHDVGHDILLNVDDIALVVSRHSSDGDYECANVYPRDPTAIDRACELFSGFLIPYYGREGKAIPYREVVKMIRDATKERKEDSPRTPQEENKETNNNDKSRARVHVRFVKPTVEEVAAYIREKGYSFSAEAFWNYYESNGWRVGRSAMKSWKSACVTWQRQEAKIAAAAKGPGRRRPDNWIGCSDAERKEFLDGLA